MGDIVSLEQDLVASLRAKGVGQQKTGKGAVLKTKKQPLLRQPQMANKLKLR